MSEFLFCVKVCPNYTFFVLVEIIQASALIFMPNLGQRGAAGALYPSRDVKRGVNNVRRFDL